jgi:uncharacterized cupin superfamily protein
VFAVEGMNVHRDDWDRTNDRDGWRTRSMSVAKRLGAEKLGATVYEIEPGQRTFPYHWHNALEEMCVVLRGEPTLRDPAGERRLAEGDVVVFLCGERGAHQLRNDTDQPVRVLMLSTQADIEIAVYPDSDKIGVSARPIGSGAPVRMLVQGTPRVGYYDGEE